MVKSFEFCEALCRLRAREKSRAQRLNCGAWALRRAAETIHQLAQPKKGVGARQSSRVASRGSLTSSTASGCAFFLRATGLLTYTPNVARRLVFAQALIDYVAQ
jgi:hypothetical protein